MAMVFLGDPEGDVRERVDEVAKGLDLGVTQLASTPEDLAALRDGQHTTPGDLLNIR
jgi:hypothetical protein